jgi:hypothetical protein
MSVSVEERFAEIERRLRLLEDGIGGSGPAERPSAGRTTSPREFLL